MEGDEDVIFGIDAAKYAVMHRSDCQPIALFCQKKHADDFAKIVSSGEIIGEGIDAYPEIYDVIEMEKHFVYDDHFDETIVITNKSII